MKYPAYPKYKDSGVEWLGEVPEHWEVKKATYCFRVIGSGTTPRSDLSDYYDGDIPWVTTSELREASIFATKHLLTEEALSHYSALKKYPVGTILMAMYGATIGRLGILAIPATVNQACCAFAWPELVDNRFFFFWLWMRRPVLISLSFGGGQPNLSQDDLRKVRIPLPPLSEQRTIAAFLDAQTSKLDALIAKKRELIDKLKEKRAALITRTVTRGLPPDAAKAAGLDPHPKMKDSGVEWLGKVPEHWEVRKLKYISSGITVGIVIEPSKYYEDEGIPCLRSFNVKQNYLTDTSLVYISEESNALLEKSMIYTGDLVVVRSGQPGVTAVVDERFDRANCIDLIIIRRPRDNYELFISYFLNSKQAQVQFSEGTGGAIQQHFNIAMAANLLIAIPPLPEQRAIAAYLDRETAAIDALVAKVETAIDRLQEYRAALITAAVTGQIDVREAVQ